MEISGENVFRKHFINNRYRYRIIVTDSFNIKTIKYEDLQYSIFKIIHCKHIHLVLSLCSLSNLTSCHRTLFHIVLYPIFSCFPRIFLWSFSLQFTTLNQTCHYFFVHYQPTAHVFFQFLLLHLASNTVFSVCYFFQFSILFYNLRTRFNRTFRRRSRS